MEKSLQANGNITKNKTNVTMHQIGDYEVEELLIARVSSNLHLGRDVQQDKPVFIEILRTTEKQDPDMAGRFQSHVESVSKIKHPNIAPVTNIGVSNDGYPYAIMEYIPGIWLDEQLSKWRSDEYFVPGEESLRLIRQIADALSVAHSANLIDPDLRPANILIRDADNTPVLMDLGVPIAVEPLDALQPNTQSNTLDYASPEAIGGEAISVRSNIYSLGVMLYELLAGHQPSVPASSWDVFERSNSPKEIPLEEERPGLSQETYHLVRNCLWRQQWSRFESADALKMAIDSAILAERSPNGTNILAGRQNRWLYVAIPIIALVVLILGLGLAWNQFAKAEQGTAADSGSLAATIGEDLAADESTAAGLAANDSTLELPAAAQPTLAPVTNVSVSDPAAAQAFASGETIGFSWLWPADLNENEQFAVYLLTEDGGGDPVLIGVTTTPGNESSYVLEKSARALGISAGSYLWKVHLEDNRDGRMLAQSDPRQIVIFQEPTSTPTEIPPTETPMATATATVVPATPAPTEVACEPAAPSGWSLHTVQPGDSFSEYSVQSGYPIQDIFAANCLADGASLIAGRTLFIPPPFEVPEPEPVETPVLDPGSSGDGG